MKQKGGDAPDAGREGGLLDLLGGGGKRDPERGRVVIRGNGRLPRRTGASGRGGEGGWGGGDAGGLLPCARSRGRVQEGREVTGPIRGGGVVGGGGTGPRDRRKRGERREGGGWLGGEGEEGREGVG